ncbi:MAG: hypothetical protein ACRD10_05530, partial [Terriglobia bacterium]
MRHDPAGAGFRRRSSIEIWCWVLCLVFGFVSATIAQDRMPKIPNDRLAEAQKKASEEFRAAQQSRA